VRLVPDPTRAAASIVERMDRALMPIGTEIEGLALLAHDTSTQQPGSDFRSDSYPNRQKIRVLSL
jgi:hypothetical protein